jgi:putative endonuclease
MPPRADLARDRTDRRARGASVEDAARRHLLRAGLQDIARNVRYKLGELDLVMRDDDCVVFVEVRYRGRADFGDGAESVDWRKRRKLVMAAQLFLQRTPSLANAPCRFDVVDASGDPEYPDLRWIRAAFRADD